MKCKKCNKKIKSGILNVAEHYKTCPGQALYDTVDNTNREHYMIAGAKAMNILTEALKQTWLNER
jgi:hypothetical protein